jgi:hypothetical protein
METEQQDLWRKCRKAFVEMIKEENFYRHPSDRWSLKQHWSGPQGGFAYEMLQKRWLDYKRGWDAAMRQ